MEIQFYVDCQSQLAVTAVSEGLNINNRLPTRSVLSLAYLWTEYKYEVAEADKSGVLTDVNRWLVRGMMEDSVHCQLKCSVGITTKHCFRSPAWTVSVTLIRLDCDRFLLSVPSPSLYLCLLSTAVVGNSEYSNWLFPNCLTEVKWFETGLMTSALLSNDEKSNICIHRNDGSRERML